MPKLSLNASKKTKHTPAGEIPVDWGWARTEEICQRISVGIVIAPSQYYTADKEGTLAFRSANVREGKINDSNWIRLNREGHRKNSKSELKQGDVLVVRTGAPGTACVVTKEFEGSNCIDLVIARPDQGRINSDYLCLFFNSDFGRRQAFSKQGGLAQKHLNVGAVAQLIVPLPPLPEQRRIADILSTWDRAIETLESLIAAKELRKQALMEQLLSGRKRLPGCARKWSKVKLSELLTPITRATTKPSSPFLAAGIRCHGRGVFLKPDFKPADIMLDELYEIRTNDLVVNITFAWEGAIAIVPEGANGALVSHRFPTYLFKQDLTCSEFFRHVIQTHGFVFECGLASPGGAGCNRVLSKKNFLKIAIPCPDLREQQAIATILDTTDRELALHRQHLESLRTQKRGLMQKLLTGEVRVVAS